MIPDVFGPMARPATPEEMGWPLVYQRRASFSTGLNVVVDGGFVAGMMTGSINIQELLASARDSAAHS